MPQPHRLVAVLFVLLWTSLAQGVTVRIRGTSRIEAMATPRADGIQVEGRLVDDAGNPIDRAPVRVALDHGGRSATPLPPAAPCPALAPPTTRGEQYVVRTDAVGRFCLRIPRGDLARRVRLRFNGDRYHDASAIEQVSVDAFRRALELEFFPAPRYLALEKETHDVWVRARVRPPDPHDEPLQLQLLHTARGGSAELVDSTSARSDERVRFSVETSRLSRPGPGVLTVRFAGSNSVQAATHDAVVETTAVVVLSLASDRSAGDPKQGIVIPVAVGSTRGAVPSGVVEALVGGRSVGSSAVRAGAAQVTARFDASRGDHALVTLRYLPNEPWWRPGEPLETTLELTRPGPWRRWPWALAVIAIALWVMRSWARPKRTQREQLEQPVEAPTGRAEVVFIERGPERGGWRGIVVDAHDGTPVDRARVRILVPSFTGSGIAAVTLTNAEGRFQLDHVDTPGEGSRLQVSAMWHAELNRDLPPAGSVSVSLITRRRALLDSLVEWARHLGRPWAGRREPTPGQVARVAAVRRSNEVREWAEAVERAAFGPEAVDETREKAIRASEPQGPPAEHT
jgi:hypothetical protein